MKRNTLNRILAAVAIGTATLATLPSQAAAFSSIVIFGDSLSDSGNNFLAGAYDPAQVITGNTYVPTSTYDQGLFPTGVYSNGPVWTTYFASALGLSAVPSLVPGGSNFAFGGAPTSGAGPVPSLSSQVGMFLAGSGNLAPSDALYVIAGGGNNARAAGAMLATPGLTLAQQISIFTSNASSFATDIGGMVDSLQAAGARNIVVWNTPNVGASPFATATGTQDLGALLASTMNDALDYRLKDEVGVKVFDVFGLVGQVQANPAAYGITNASDACGALVNNCDPATALFWDGIHPTTQGHQLIAGAMLVTAVPEPATYGLMGLGLLAVFAAARRRAA